MSAIASFYLLDSSKLNKLNEKAQVTDPTSIISTGLTDNFYDYLAGNATELKGFEGSGYIYASLLVYLEDVKNIPLMSNEYDEISKELAEKRDCSLLVFTNAQRQSYLTQLNHDLYSLTEIQDFNQDLSGEGDEETARLTLNAIKVLHDNLAEVQNDEQVLLLIIG
jgi:hypothetical protein